jgi:predicted nucleic acid-binding protein
MSGRTFVDTNVLIYAHDLDAGPRHVLASSRLSELWTSRQGFISAQVLQEFYVNVTRKIARPISRKAARDVLKAYAPWCTGRIRPEDIVKASELEERHRISFWDALIVVSAVLGGAARILSEDLNAGQSIEGVIVENPFVPH